MKDMQTRTLGLKGPTVSALGLGCMGMSRVLRRDRRGRGDRHDPPRARARRARSSTPPTCTARTPTSELRRHGASPAAATRSCWRRSSASCATDDDPPRAAIDGTPGVRARRRCEALAAAPGRRPHRPLLPAPRRPGHADRGDRRRAWPSSSQRGQGPPPRPVARPAPETIRRAHAVHPITALQTEYSLWSRDVEDGDPADAARAGHRPRRLLAARPRVPHGPLQLDRRARRGRLPPLPAALHGREPRAQPPSWSTKLGELAAEQGRARRRSSRSRGCSPQGEDIVPIPGTKRRAYLEENLGGRRRRAHRRRPRADRRRAARRPPASATTASGMTTVNR